MLNRTRTAVAVALTIALAALAAACTTDHPPFVCHQDSNCEIEDGGRCWHSPEGYDTCAYPDDACPTGWRWNDSDDFTQCIAAENVCPSEEPNACN